MSHGSARDDVAASLPGGPLDCQYDDSLQAIRFHPGRGLRSPTPCGNARRQTAEPPQSLDHPHTAGHDLQQVMIAGGFQACRTGGDRKMSAAAVLSATGG